jgi:hypothetical protein
MSIESMEYDAYEAKIVEAYEAKLREKDKLITELADALEWCWRDDAQDESLEHRESMNLAHGRLIQRSREATR